DVEAQGDSQAKHGLPGDAVAEAQHRQQLGVLDIEGEVEGVRHRSALRAEPASKIPGRIERRA
ncbi:hypothetical protein LTR94_025731, partial [Friedmanniomyces endolithicus]